MLKTFFLFFFLFFFQDYLFSQIVEADSLKNILKQKISPKDEINALLQLSSFYINKDYNISYEYLNKATDKANQINDKYLQNFCKIGLANIYRFITKNEEAIRLTKETLEYGYKYNQDKLILESLKTLGMIYMNMEYKSLALKFFLEILEHSDDEQFISNSGARQWVAAMYADQKEYQKALFYLQKDLETKKRNKKIEISSTLSEIGNVYYRQKKYEKALRCYIEGYAEGKKLKNIYTITYTSNNIGLVKFRQKKYEEAIFYFNEAIEYAKKCKSDKHISNTLSNLTQLYQEKKEYKTAVEFGEKSFLIAKKINDMVLILETSNVLANIYQSMNDNEKRNFYLEQKFIYQDSMLLLKQQKEVFTIELHQKMIKKNKEAKKLVEEKNLLYFYFILIIIAFFALIIIAYLLFKRNKLKQEIIYQHEKIVSDLEEKRQLEKRINLLEQARLQEKTEMQARQLSGQATLLMQKNEWLVSIENQFKIIQDSLGSEQKRAMKKIFVEMKETINLENYWENYKKQFEEVHPTFFINIQKRFPKTTPNDLKMCVYLRMNLSSKEIAQMLNITDGSLKVNFNRLKKKLDLDETQNLREFIREF